MGDSNGYDTARTRPFTVITPVTIAQLHAILQFDDKISVMDLAITAKTIACLKQSYPLLTEHEVMTRSVAMVERARKKIRARVAKYTKRGVHIAINTTEENETLRRLK